MLLFEGKGRTSWLKRVAIAFLGLLGTVSRVDVFASIEPSVCLEGFFGEVSDGPRTTVIDIAQTDSSLTEIGLMSSDTGSFVPVLHYFPTLSEDTTVMRGGVAGPGNDATCVAPGGGGRGAALADCATYVKTAYDPACDLTLDADVEAALIMGMFDASSGLFTTGGTYIPCEQHVLTQEQYCYCPGYEAANVAGPCE